MASGGADLVQASVVRRRIRELLRGAGLDGWLDRSVALGMRVAAEVVPSDAPPPKSDEKRVKILLS